MKKVKVNEVREHLAKYLTEAEKGEEIVITRHSRPVARLMPVDFSEDTFPALSDHRKEIKTKGKSLSETVIELRKKERY